MGEKENGNIGLLHGIEGSLETGNHDWTYSGTDRSAVWFFYHSAKRLSCEH